MILERIAGLWEDERQTKRVYVKSWEISGVDFPKEKALPVTLKMSYQPPMYLTCSHQGSDMFLAFEVTFWQHLKLRWHRFWHGHADKS